MDKFFSGLASLILLLTFCAIVLWGAVLIPVLLGVALVCFLLFWFVLWFVDLLHNLWRRIRSPPVRKRQR